MFFLDPIGYAPFIELLNISTEAKTVTKKLETLFEDAALDNFQKLQAVFDPVLTQAISYLPFASTIASADLFNVSLATAIRIHSWKIAQKVLSHENAYLLDLGNIISALWEAIAAEQKNLIPVIQACLEKNPTCPVQLKAKYQAIATARNFLKLKSERSSPTLPHQMSPVFLEFISKIPKNPQPLSDED